MEGLKKLAKAWNSLSLIKRIVIGLVIGALLGVFAPPGLTVVALLGTIFVNALKAVAPILVFFLVISSLANAKSAGAMKTVVVLYLVGTFVAAIVAVVASTLFPVDLTLATTVEDTVAPSGVGEVLGTLITNAVANPVKALAEANYLGILAWAVLLGVAVRVAGQPVKDVFTSISDAISTVVRWIIAFAPFGILGLVYTSVSENGLKIFTEYGQLIVGAGGLHGVRRAGGLPAPRVLGDAPETPIRWCCAA